MDPTRDKGAPAPTQPTFATEYLLDDLEGRSVRGGAVTVTAQLCRLGLTLGATAVLARQLTPADFGLVAMVHAIIGFLSMFGEAGLSAATVQRQQIDHRQVSTLFWLNVALGCAFMLLLAAAAPAVAWFFREPRLLGVTMVLAAVFPVTALAIQHRALLTRQLRFTPLAAVSVLSQAVGYGIAIVAASRGAGYWALVLAALVTPAAQTLGIWVASGWLPGRPVRGSGVRSMVRFGGELTGFDLLNYGAANLDRLLLGRFWGATSLGLYSRAYQLLMMPVRQINTPVAAVAVPVLSRLQDDSERYRLVYLSMMEKVAMVTMLLAAVMILTADWLIALILGPQWNEAAELFVYLGVAALLLPTANTSGWLFVSQGRSGHMLRWGFLDAGIKIASVALGLPWGPAASPWR